MRCAKDIARHKNDKVYAVHIIGERDVDHAEKQIEFQTYASDIGLKLEDFFMIKKNDEGLHETLTPWANENELEFDFMIVGAKGHGADRSTKYFSKKLLTGVLQQTVLNTIVVPRSRS